VFNSVDSLTRIISPLIGAMVIQFLGPKYLGIVIASSLFFSYLIFSFKFVPTFANGKELEVQSSQI